MSIAISERLRAHAQTVDQADTINGRRQIPDDQARAIVHDLLLAAGSLDVHLAIPPADGIDYEFVIVEDEAP